MTTGEQRSVLGRTACRAQLADPHALEAALSNVSGNPRTVFDIIRAYLRMPANNSRGTRGAISNDAATVRCRRYVETSVKESSVNEAIVQ
jgi:hypothetical protein